MSDYIPICQFRSVSGIKSHSLPQPKTAATSHFCSTGGPLLKFSFEDFTHCDTPLTRRPRPCWSATDPDLAVGRWASVSSGKSECMLLLVLLLLDAGLREKKKSLSDEEGNIACWNSWCSQSLTLQGASSSRRGHWPSWLRAHEAAFLRVAPLAFISQMKRN